VRHFIDGLEAVPGVVAPLWQLDGNQRLVIGRAHSGGKLPNRDPRPAPTFI
jgi:hypothetical protein